MSNSASFFLMFIAAAGLPGPEHSGSDHRYRPTAVADEDPSRPGVLTVGRTELKLNGTGIRRKSFIPLYRASLYLETPQTDAGRIVDQNCLVVIRLTILSKLISAKRLQESVRTAFEKNSARRDRTTDREIDQLLALFPSRLKLRSTIDLCYVPSDGTHVFVEDEFRGRVGNEGLRQALLSCWLSDNPVSGELKKALCRGGVDQTATGK